MRSRRLFDFPDLLTTPTDEMRSPSSEHFCLSFSLMPDVERFWDLVFEFEMERERDRRPFLFIVLLLLNWVGYLVTESLIMEIRFELLLFAK